MPPDFVALALESFDLGEEDLLIACGPGGARRQSWRLTAGRRAGHGLPRDPRRDRQGGDAHPGPVEREAHLAGDLLPDGGTAWGRGGTWS